MRADRLLALLMILQSRGRQTAGHLAAELEVTERTIYRDVLALSTAGVPVYAERGPGGGIALLEDYRTNLTGLTTSEARALFMLSIPAPLVDLGLNLDLQSALRKLAAALPSARSSDASHLLQRVHLDWLPWEGQAEPAPHLETLHKAAWQERLLALTYRSPLFGDWIEPLHVQAAPYGLVAKAGRWYLVCMIAEHMQVIPVYSVLAAEQLDGIFTRPTGFDLAEFWQDWCARQAEGHLRFAVRLRAAPNALRMLRSRFADLPDPLTGPSPGSSPDAWKEYEVNFESLEEARAYLLSCGQAVEVLAPQALRLSLVDYARQIADFYSML